MTPREYLSSLEFHGIKLGLDNIRFLLAPAGNPHNLYPTLHVAGTNGKGSVVAMLDAMLRAAGYRAGRFTSPHLIRVNERFMVNSTPIEDADLDTEIEIVRAIAGTMSSPPTYFEACTAIAFRWFSRMRVDAAVIEVGMGGRFDSTNVVTPLVSVITNIDLEHVQYLGDTLEKIAFEKAGIIKKGVPVVVAEQSTGALTVILDRAQGLGAPTKLLNRDFTYESRGELFNQQFSYRGPVWNLNDVRLGLAGRYQSENAAVAVATAECLVDAFPRLTLEAVRGGLESARWPCRLERVIELPPVIVDVAHNPAGMRKLAAELNRCIAVVAVSSDKAASEMLKAIRPVAKEIILTEFDGDRALPVERLIEAAAGISHRRADTLELAIAQGIELAGEDCPLVLTGSIFTAGQAREILSRRFQAAGLTF